MISFRCKNCGQKIRVPEMHSGKKGKCPKCKHIVVVPEAGNAYTIKSQIDSGSPEIRSVGPYGDLSLLDIPQKYDALNEPIGQDGVAGESFEDVQRLEERAGIDETEPAGKRKFPWLIDVLLYPISTPGLTILGIIIGVPLLFRILVWLLGLFTLGFPPMLVFLVLFACIGFVINIILYLYMYWYFCECIRDSADGGLRAPDVLVNAPSVGDMFWQTLRIIGCLAFFTAPMLIYYRRAQETDTVFWALLGYAVFFFPMGLLAVIMFDSFAGLNPILLIGSIFSTFLPYCAMISAFGSVAYLVAQRLPDIKPSYALVCSLKCLSVYLAMVSAHILGWFYHRYQDELNWEV